MKIPIQLAKKLLLLTEGESMPASRVKHRLTEELVKEGIISRSGRVQKKIWLPKPESLQLYLQNNYGISDLRAYIAVHQKEDASRGDLTSASSDSKLKQLRTFKGFLVNGYELIQATFNEEPMTLDFRQGIFQFIYDYENFSPDKDITIVEVENAENFRFIEKQKHLFKNIRPLFVSRYPQNQSKDLIKWLQSIPNS